MHTIKFTTPELDYLKKLIQGCKDHWYYEFAPLNELQVINNIMESLNEADNN